MEKLTKIVLIIIGSLSILAGIFAYFYKNDTPIDYFAIFIGVAIIGSVFLIETKKKD